MSFIIIITSIIFMSSSVFANTWYVRPIGGSYGTEDGSTYENSYNGFLDIVWGGAGIQEGDTLYICGTHREELYVGVSNMSIRLDYTTDKGIIYGSNQISGNDAGWSGPDGNGEYKIALTTECKVVVMDGTILLMGSVGSLSATRWDWSGGNLYLGFNPAGHIFEVGQRNHAVTWLENSLIQNTSLIGDAAGNSIIYYTNQYSFGPRDLYPENFNDGDPNYSGKINYGTLTLSGMRIEGSQALQTYYWFKVDTINISNNMVYDSATEAFYINSTNTTLNVTNNIIGASNRNMSGWMSNGTALSGDAIDIKGGNSYQVLHAIVSGNTITNVRGSGVTSGLADIIIENNTFINVGWSLEEYGIIPTESYAAIRLTGATKLLETDKQIVRYNTIINDVIFDDGIIIGKGTGSNVITEIYGAR